MREHTRNQRRMYRIHKQDEKILEQELLISSLQNKLQQKENIIKEVREYIMSELITEYDIKNGGCVSGSDLPVDAITPILEILDKGK